MARTKSQPAELTPDVTLNPELEATQNLMAVVSSHMTDERDLLNQLLGQAQMADAFAQFSKTVLTSKMAFVKENKLYQSLKGKKGQDGLEFSGTWAEFCNLLGYTPEHANESINNLQSFGEEALESMSRMGIGYRELRQFRRLPEDQKSALIEVAKEGDKTALLDLAEEMIAKHAREKEELKTDLEISRQMLAEKKKNSARYAMRKRSLRPAWSAVPPPRRRTKKAWRLRQKSPALKVAFSARSSTLKAALTRWQSTPSARASTTPARWRVCLTTCRCSLKHCVRSSVCRKPAKSVKCRTG